MTDVIALAAKAAEACENIKALIKDSFSPELAKQFEKYSNDYKQYAEHFPVEVAAEKVSRTWVAVGKSPAATPALTI